MKQGCLPLALAAMLACGAAQARPQAQPQTQAQPAQSQAQALGQPTSPVHTAPAQPATVKEADGASIDATLAALYDVISGPAGAPRNWNRMRALFVPDAKLSMVTPKEGGGYALRAMTVEDYISRNMSTFSANGFYEKEIARRTESFGQLAHVFSTYELLRAPHDAKPFMRGINSIQLVHDGKRWWIANLVWRAEDAHLTLPERYLQNQEDAR